MSSATVFADATDGYVNSDDSVAYANARNGVGDGGLNPDTGSAQLWVGQNFQFGFYDLYEGFVSFDLFAAGVAAWSVASSPALQFWLGVDVSTTDFTIEARACDWGASLAASAFVPGASLASLPLLASLTTAGLSAGAYFTLTENGTSLTAAINSALGGSGKLRLLLCSSRTTNNNAPVGSEYVRLASADTAGTGNDPKLDFTYVAGAPAMGGISGRRAIGLHRASPYRPRRVV